jgi:hypothetical protein
MANVPGFGSFSIADFDAFTRELSRTFQTNVAQVEAANQRQLQQSLEASRQRNQNFRQMASLQQQGRQFGMDQAFRKEEFNLRKNQFEHQNRMSDLALTQELERRRGQELLGEFQRNQFSSGSDPSFIGPRLPSGATGAESRFSSPDSVEAAREFVRQRNLTPRESFSFMEAFNERQADIAESESLRVRSGRGNEPSPTAIVDSVTRSMGPESVQLSGMTESEMLQHVVDDLNAGLKGPQALQNLRDTVTSRSVVANEDVTRGKSFGQQQASAQDEEGVDQDFLNRVSQSQANAEFNELVERGRFSDIKNVVERMESFIESRIGKEVGVAGVQAAGDQFVKTSLENIVIDALIDKVKVIRDAAGVARIDAKGTKRRIRGKEVTRGGLPDKDARALEELVKRLGINLEEFVD